jgi:hypothetical protein
VLRESGEGGILGEIKRGETQILKLQPSKNVSIYRLAPSMEKHDDINVDILQINATKKASG